MKVFVTGAGGFIGGAVCRHLAAEGHAVLGHVAARDGVIQPSSIPEDVEVIVNAAGKLGKPGSRESELTSSNALLPEMLGSVCRSGGIHLIHISTPGVAGLCADSTEDSPLAPWGEYERSKAEGETLLRKHLYLPGGLLTVLRPDFVYGPGDNHKLELFRMVSRGLMPLIGRNGAVIRPTFVGDVCRAVSASLPGGCLQGDLFNIGGPETVSIRELTSIIAKSLNQRVVLIPLPRWAYRLAPRLGPLRPASISESRRRLFGDDHYVSIRKASLAGFKPSWGLREGVDATVSWYRSEGLIRC
jgi:nucleoside-diphosphate-sugar epimerase